MNILTEWILFLSESIVVSILSDSTAISRLLVVRVRRNEGVREPADLLGGSLLPLASLAGVSAASGDSSLHGFLLEDLVDAGRVKLVGICCLSLWSHE